MHTLMTICATVLVCYHLAPVFSYWRAKHRIAKQAAKEQARRNAEVYAERDARRQAENLAILTMDRPIPVSEGGWVGMPYIVNVESNSHR